MYGNKQDDFGDTFRVTLTHDDATTQVLGVVSQTETVSVY